MPTDDAPRRAARAKPATAGEYDVTPALPPVEVPKKAYAKTSRDAADEDEMRREMEQEEWEAREQIKIDWEEKQRKRFWLLRFMEYANNKFDAFVEGVASVLSTLFRSVAKAIEFLLWLHVLFNATVGSLVYFSLLASTNGAVQEISASSIRTSVLINSFVLAFAYSVVMRFSSLPGSKNRRRITSESTY